MYDEINVLNILKEIARSSGSILMKYFCSDDLQINTKQTAADMVTTADIESDKYIREKLIENFPDAGLITEEGHNIEPKIKGENERWFCADPLDGTTNFSCNLGIFSVSIAMLDKDHQTLIGVVYDPNRDEMFYAIKGKGAFMEARGKTTQIHCRDNERLINCLVATGFSPDHISNPDNNIKELSVILPKVRCIRRLGSACLDCCYIACKRIDAYWENGPHIWDIAAGSLIVTESGGIVTDYKGEHLTKEKLHMPKINLIISTPKVHGDLVKLIRSVRE